MSNNHNLALIVQQHALGIRPATSPTPTAMFTDVRKTTQRANSKLRPLPPRSSPASFNMMMEGCKTGIEKPVTAVERREAVQGRPAAERERKSVTQPPVPDSGDREKEKERDREREKDAARIRKLEAELKKCQAALKEKGSENDSQAERITELECSLARQQGEADRFMEKLKALSASNAAKSAELTNLQTALARHEKGASAAGAEAQELAAQLQQLQSSHRTAEQKWEGEKTGLEQAVAKLRDDVAAAKQALDYANRKASDELSTLKGSKEKLDLEWKEARDREAALRSEAQKAKQQLAESEKRLAEWKGTIETCNRYIVNICQPSFSVVKDESLAPVTPGSPDGGGYVLVPLPLLLEGYGLLPPELKKKIAEDYERSKKADAQVAEAAANAGSFAMSHVLQSSEARATRTPSVPTSRGSVRK